MAGKRDRLDVDAVAKKYCKIPDAQRRASNTVYASGKKNKFKKYRQSKDCVIRLQRFVLSLLFFQLCWENRIHLNLSHRTEIAGQGLQDMDGRTWTGLLILKTFGIAQS